MVQALKLYDYSFFIPSNCYESVSNGYVASIINSIYSFSREFSGEVRFYNESSYENGDRESYSSSVFLIIESNIDEPIRYFFEMIVGEHLLFQEIPFVNKIALKFADGSFSFSSQVRKEFHDLKREIKEAINGISEAKFNNVTNADYLSVANNGLVVIHDFIIRIEIIIAISSFIENCKFGHSIDAKGKYHLFSLVKNHLDEPLKEYFTYLALDIFGITEKVEANQIMSELFGNNFSFSKFIENGIKADNSDKYCKAEHILREVISVIRSIRQSYLQSSKGRHCLKHRQSLYTALNMLNGLMDLVSCIKNLRSEHTTDEDFNRIKRKKNHGRKFCELCWRPLGTSYIQMLNSGENEDWNRQKISWYIYDVLKCNNSKVTNKKLFKAFDAFVQALLIKVMHKLSSPIFIELIRENIDAPLKDYFLSLDKRSLKPDVEFIVSDFPFSERFAPGMWSLSEVSEHILDAIWEVVSCDVSSQEYEELLQLKEVLEVLYDVATIPEIYPEAFDDMAREIYNNERFCNIHLPSLPSGEYYSDQKYKAAFEEKIALLLSYNKVGVLDLRGEAVRKMAYRICRPSSKSNTKIIRKYSKIGLTPKQLTEKFGFAQQSISKALKEK